ncbi:MAG: type II toxin-antitoxin system death-on-curing family toxin [Betaproteobacteria bacterium]|nr:type II toxin-antitoxin system death-on-curing family toxin [Betaproteobacteria bacterium]
MKRWIWLDATDAIAYHAELVAAHGGDAGLRDRGLLESALARPQNSAAYGEPTVFELATAYAFGIAKNHPFVDGNKRVALVTSVTFLELNGWRFVANEADSAIAFLDLAAGQISEKEFARWLETSCQKAVRQR